MPTGYTAGILDGTTQNFEQFAKHCMRAFGACMHLRDDSFDAPYKKQEVSEYHSKEIKKLEDEKRMLSITGDQSLEDKIVSELKDSKDSYAKHVQTAKDNSDLLNSYINKVKSWDPPTTDHAGVKEFMLQQLSETLNYDANPSFYSQGLSDITLEIINFDVKTYRQDRTKAINEKLKYHTEELFKETERVNNSNKWVEDYINSL